MQKHGGLSVPPSSLLNLDAVIFIINFHIYNISLNNCTSDNSFDVGKSDHESSIVTPKVG